MSKGPFDHIENKIREAAEHSEPPFNEHAWEKMELLLDKEKRKRRFIFWWWAGLPLALVGIGLAGYLLYPKQADNKQLAARTTQSITDTSNMIAAPAPDTGTIIVTRPADESQPSSTATKTITSTEAPEPATTKKAPVTASGSAPAGIGSAKSVSPTGGKNSLNVPSQDSKDVAKTKDGRSGKSNKGGSDKRKLAREGRQNISSSVEIEDATAEASPTGTEKTPGVTKSDLVQTGESINTDKKTGNPVVGVTPKEQQATADSNTKKTATKLANKNSTPSKRGFYFIAAAGAEIIKTKALSYSHSELSPRYGISAGYAFGNRLSLQAGFFAGRKKYTGEPGDYHPKQGTYLSTVNIKKVEASCMIYDIPISVRYDFPRKKGLQWYATAGITSFIMKKEDYNYYYTYYNMPYMVHEKAYSYTGNKNLFANFSFSAGVEKPLSKHTSLLIEPYLSLPAKGVGEGAVKLYSTGLQVGFKYKPGS